MSDFYVVSLKHTQKRHPCISFWRPNNSGYAWPMPWFGRYGEDQVREEVFYYNDGVSTLAVPCEAIEPLLASPPAGVSTAMPVRWWGIRATPGKPCST